MGQPIPYRWLVITGVLLALIAAGLFWWASWEPSGKGPVFLIGLGFIAASGVLGCTLLAVYQLWCRIRRNRRPPLE